MILNGYFYPDKQWLACPHRIEPSGSYKEDDFSKEKVFTGNYAGDYFLSIIQGNREAGKSVGVGVFAIADFLLYGYENVLLRRYQTDFTEKDAMKSFWEKSWPYRNEFKNVISKHPKLQEIYPLELVNKFDFINHTITFKNNMAFIDNKPFSHDASLWGEGPTNFKQRVFHNVYKIIYDEFIPEKGAKVIDNEITKFLIIAETAARGRSDARQTIGAIFISNMVSDDNIWAKAYNFKEKIRKDSKYITNKEKSYTVEKVYNKIVAEEVKKSPLGRFSLGSGEGQAYYEYSQENKTQDDLSFVEKLDGDMRYLFNIIYAGNYYAMKFSSRYGMYYFTDEGIDKDCKQCYAVTRKDHSLDTKLITTVLKRRMTAVKLYYGSGQIRFNSIISKNVFVDIYPLI